MIAGYRHDIGLVHVHEVVVFQPVADLCFAQMVDLHRFCSGHVLMLGGPLFEGHW